MDFFVSLMLSPWALAAVFVAMYYIYPTPLVHGYKIFGGYLVAGLYRKFLQLENSSFCYYERPAPIPDQHKATTVLLLHGFTANKTMWMVVSKFLPKDWRIVVLDLPGHGESSFTSDGNYSAFGLARKLHDFIESMDLQNLHLVGISLGALVSATYASQHSHRLTSLTLMCPPITHKMQKGIKTKFFEELETTGKNFILPNNAEEFQEMMELVLYNSSAYTFHRRMREALLGMQLPLYSQFKKIQADLLNGDENEEFIKKLAANITAPTLIAWGEHDRICHPSGAAILKDLINDSEVVMLPKCGHAVTMDRPRKCAQVLRNFIGRHAVTMETTAQ